ncbi:solute carrier family 35 member C2 isoform X2 [Paroedura picta]|uniref:solute carrier family 35 member C2 isoform X2 n=1 Tax=Paroedura picta TaxID=143630 RepID=UPI004057066D
MSGAVPGTRKRRHGNRGLGPRGAAGADGGLVLVPSGGVVGSAGGADGGAGAALLRLLHRHHLLQQVAHEELRLPALHDAAAPAGHLRAERGGAGRARPLRPPCPSPAGAAPALARLPAPGSARSPVHRPGCRPQQLELPLHHRLALHHDQVLRHPLHPVFFPGLQTGGAGLQNPIDTMFHLQPLMFLGLFPLFAVFEGLSLSSSEKLFRCREAGVLLGLLGKLALGGVLAFGLGFSEFLLVSRTSSLALSISGILKEVCTLLLATQLLGDHLSVLNWLGFAVCLLGICLHVALKAFGAKGPKGTKPHKEPDSDLELLLLHHPEGREAESFPQH